MIMSARGSERRETDGERHAFVFILHALFDCVCWPAKDGTPYLSVDGHERREEAYFTLWGL